MKSFVGSCRHGVSSLTVSAISSSVVVRPASSWKHGVASGITAIFRIRRVVPETSVPFYRKAKAVPETPHESFSYILLARTGWESRVQDFRTGLKP